MDNPRFGLKDWDDARKAMGFGREDGIGIEKRLQEQGRMDMVKWLR